MRQPTIVTSLTDLERAHVAVASLDGGLIRLTVSGPFAAVEMTGTLDVVRQLLSDGEAQLDAIAVSHPTDP